MLSFLLVLCMVLTLVPVFTTQVSAASLSAGQKNIVARAYQQVQIKWTPVKNVDGYLNSKGTLTATYKKGTTYQGIPYGQLVDSGKYVPNSASFDTFLKAVANENSVFYTSRGKYGKLESTYYGSDCSAFVSYAYGIGRMTTTGIASSSQFTKVSGGIQKAQVGDCYNKSGDHVVLITGLTYDSNGKVTKVEISEQTPPKARTITYTAAQIESKFESGGYTLLRFKNRDSVAAPVSYTGYKSLSDSSIISELDQDDNGKIYFAGFERTSRLYDGSKQLTEGTDYTVSYKNNVNVGTMTATFTGKGNYTGTKTSTIQIIPYDISGSDSGSASWLKASLAYTSTEYDNSAKTPKVTLVYDAYNSGTKVMTLTEGTDYTVSYKNNTNAGTATAVVTGKGNFTGTRNLTFKITKKITDSSIVSDFDQDSNGKIYFAGYERTSRLYDGSRQMTEGTDYSVSYKDNVNVGTMSATFTGKGVYTGTKYNTIEIVPYDISGEDTGSASWLTANLEYNQTKYTGQACTPKVTLTYNAYNSNQKVMKLTEGTDYTVTYKNNVNVGTATVVVTGKGNFTGTRLIDFTIAKTDVVLFLHNNFSGKNYLSGTDFTGVLNEEEWISRNESASTLTIDRSMTHNGYNSLRIDNAVAGSPQNDLTIITSTTGRAALNENPDQGNKDMTLSFWAKSSNPGAKFYVRWGYEPQYRSVNLSTEWAYYTIPMNHTTDYDGDMHPYIDCTGTVWLSEIQLEDGSSATTFVPESSGWYQQSDQVAGSKYVLPNSPTRSGYVFSGWFTARNGGTRITSDSIVPVANVKVYAHWSSIIKIQPKNIFIMGSEYATFNVVTEGNNFTYQWQYKGPTSDWENSTSTGYDTDTITVQGVTGKTNRNGYQYRCVITDANGNQVISDPATLTVAEELKITTQPKDYTGMVNSIAKFTVIASGDGLTYQWQYSDDNGATWLASSLKSATYSAKLTAEKNNRMVRCVVTDQYGISVTSDAAKMTLSGPTITTQPKDYTGAVNSTARFTVAASGDGLKYQWQYSDDNGKTWLASSIKSAAYSAKFTAEKNGRMVRCIVSDQYGSSVTSNAAKMALNGPIITTQPKDYVGAVNSTAKFTVAASGSGLTYQWQYSDDNGKTWLASSLKSATYSAKFTAEKNNRMVRCIVTDASGSSVTSNAAKMTLSGPVITAQPQNYVGAVNSTAKFTVTANGNGLTYQWQYSDDSGKTWLASTLKSAAYSAKFTTEKNNRMVRCIVTDASGNSLTSNPASMTIG